MPPWAIQSNSYYHNLFSVTMLTELIAWSEVLSWEANSLCQAVLPFIEPMFRRAHHYNLFWTSKSHLHSSIIILQFWPSSPKWSLLITFSDYDFMCVYHYFHAWYMLCPFQPFWEPISLYSFTLSFVLGQFIPSWRLLIEHHEYPKRNFNVICQQKMLLNRKQATDILRCHAKFCLFSLL